MAADLWIIARAKMESLTQPQMFFIGGTSAGSECERTKRAKNKQKVHI